MAASSNTEEQEGPEEVSVIDVSGAKEGKTSKNNPKPPKAVVPQKLRLMMTPPVDHPPACDRRDERGLGGLLGVEAVRAPPDVDEDVLDGVLDLVRIGRQA